MKILHICHVDSVRFLGKEGYFEKSKRALYEYEHFFYILNDSFIDNMANENDVYYKKYDNKQLSKLCELLSEADRVVLHSMHSEGLIQMYYLIRVSKKLNKKIVWLIWGHDLYDAYYAARCIKGLRWGYIMHFLKSAVAEIFRRKLIRELYCIIGEKSDIDLVKKLYNTDAKLMDYNFLGYGTEQPIDCKSIEKSTKRIFVGNHLDPHCRYEETFRKIASIDDGKLEVFCVARGYTEKNKYSKETIGVGRKLFGERLHLITDFSRYEDYCKLLSTMDIAIFNIDRQMAQGTAFILLYYGKKVFFSRENGNYNEFASMGIKVFNMDEFNRSEIDKKFSKEEVEQIRDILIEQLSDDSFCRRWKTFLD